MAWLKTFRTQRVIRRDKDGDLRRLYDCSLEQYEQMFGAQQGLCAICGRPPDDRALHVDHDHETGQRRGLLCGSCNTGLGLFGEDRARLLDAIRYLERYAFLAEEQ